MEEVKNILYPIALTDISKRVAPYPLKQGRKKGFIDRHSLLYEIFMRPKEIQSIFR